MFQNLLQFQNEKKCLEVGCKKKRQDAQKAEKFSAINGVYFVFPHISLLGHPRAFFFLLPTCRHFFSLYKFTQNIWKPSLQPVPSNLRNIYSFLYFLPAVFSSHRRCLLELCFSNIRFRSIRNTDRGLAHFQLGNCNNF